jgi:hypothetical protein
MANKRNIEIFTAGCPCCDEAVQLVREMACPSCKITIYNLAEGCETNECRQKAKDYGIKRVPAVVVDGQLASCCAGNGVDRDALAEMGIGSAG